MKILIILKEICIKHAERLIRLHMIGGKRHHKYMSEK